MIRSFVEGFAMRTIDKRPIDEQHTVPSVWRDFSRDWNCWSMAERALAMAVVSAAPTLLLTYALA
jgi:hypothetical protein